MGYQPTWKQFEDKANNQHDARAALNASDAFEQERAKELKNSKAARDWEKGRKKEWANNKPKYVKDRVRKEQEALISPLKKLKQGGSFVGNIKPMPGYLILEIEANKKETESGIVLPDADQESNTGVVVEVSEPLQVSNEMGLSVVDCPVKVGDKVLFKRGAGAFGSPGLELTINGKDYRLMRWNIDPAQSDLLGVFI